MNYDCVIALNVWKGLGFCSLLIVSLSQAERTWKEVVEWDEDLS